MRDAESALNTEEYFQVIYKKHIAHKAPRRPRFNILQNCLLVPALLLYFKKNNLQQPSDDEWNRKVKMA